MSHTKLFQLLSWFSLKLLKRCSESRGISALFFCSSLYDPIRLLLPRLPLIQVRPVSIGASARGSLSEGFSKQGLLWSQLKLINRAQRPGRIGAAAAPILTWECQTCCPSWEQTARCFSLRLLKHLLTKHMIRKQLGPHLSLCHYNSPSTEHQNLHAGVIPSSMRTTSSRSRL